jgi:hypothetical protein
MSKNEYSFMVEHGKHIIGFFVFVIQSLIAIIFFWMKKEIGKIQEKLEKNHDSITRLEAEHEIYCKKYTWRKK